MIWSVAGLVGAGLARPKWLVSGGASTLLLVVSALMAFAILAFCSHPAGPAGLRWLALYGLGIVAVCCWLAVAVHSLVRRRLPLGLVIAPLIGVLTVGLVYTGDVSKLRFALIDRHGFEAVVAQAPAPVITLPNRDLTETTPKATPPSNKSARTGPPPQ